MKKLLAIFLTIILAFAMMTACQSPDDPSTGGDNKFEGHDIGEAVYVTVVDAGLGSGWIEALAEAYFEETGITVEVASDPSLVSSVETKMGQTYSDKDDIYFVAQGNSNWLDWTNKNKIAALDDVVNSEKYGTAAADRTRDSYTFEIGKYNEATYLLPYIYSNWGLIYNKDYLDQIESYGEYEKGKWPETMQGLIDLCAATKTAGIKNPRTGKTVEPFSCGLTVNYMNYLFYSLWDELDSEGLTGHLTQNNPAAFDSSKFNSSAVKQVFEILYDLIGAKSTTESNLCSNAENHLDAQTNFVNGNCVFTFSGVWFETEMKNTLNSVGMTSYHYGAYPVIDKANDHRLYMNLPGEFFFIPSDAENVWGAKDFLAFCMSEKGVAAAERVLNIPLSYTTNESVEYTNFGKEVKAAVENSKKLYIFSENNVYKTGALNLFKQTPNPFLKMSKYQITNKSQIQSMCIDSEITQINSIWQDYMQHI